MIKPKPFKMKCIKCGYSKVIAPKNDTLIPLDFPLFSCPKCDEDMEKVKLNVIDNIRHKYIF